MISWFCFTFHQLSNDFDLAYIDPELPDYEARRLKQDFINFFFVGVDFSALIIAWVLVDIHWIYMGLCVVMYSLIQIVHVNIKF